MRRAGDPSQRGGSKFIGQEDRSIMNLVLVPTSGLQWLGYLTVYGMAYNTRSSGFWRSPPQPRGKVPMQVDFVYRFKPRDSGKRA